MEGKLGQRVVICSECGERITEKDQKDGNTRLVDGKLFHEKCRRITK